MSGYDDLFEAAGQKYNVDPKLLQTVFQVESGGNANTPDSYQGAQGGMQMLPATAAAMGASNPRDMTQAVPAAARYLAEGLDATGTPQGALAYYHGGPDRAQWGPKTAAYVAKGQSVYQTLGSQPVAQKQADDPDLAAGQAAFDAMTAGGPAPRGDAAKAADPDEAAGMAAFQSMTANAKAPAAAAPNPDAGANEYGITGDPQQFNGGRPAAPQPTDSAMGRVASAVAQGAREGYGDAAVGLPAEVQQKWADLGPVGGFIGRNIVSPLYGVGQVAVKDSNALLRGAQGGVAQLGAEVGAPQLGRDIAALPEAFPFGPGHEAGGIPVRGVEAAKEAPKATVTEITPADLAAARNKLTAPAEPAARPNALTGDAPVAAPQAPVNALTGAAAPSPQPGMGAAPTGAAVPQSVGAAASAADEATMTPKETQAYRSVGEREKLNEPQPTGQADPNAYVPGVTPNKAEIEQSVNTARDLKALGTAHPEVSQEAKTVAAENNEARRQHFQQLAGSDVDVMNAKAARDAQAETDLTAAFGNKKDVSPQPVLDLADQLKTSPDGKRPLVRSVIDSVTAEMTDADGNLTTDPEQLYGVRKHIDDLMSREANAGDQKNLRAAAQLQQIKGKLDEVIEQGAPGFRQYLDNFSQASRPIDAMQALQGFENKLYTGSDRRMGYNQVQNMMRQIVEARQGPGLNQFKSIPDETMQQLWNLRDDLRRSASAQELARAPGSDTAQNLMDLMRLGGNAAVHGAANMVAPGVGSLAVGAVKQGLAPILANRANRKAVSRGVELLHPKTPLRNPLLEP